ncbi:uncharacterized protein FN964_002623 [Alca torda]
MYHPRGRNKRTDGRNFPREKRELLEKIRIRPAQVVLYSCVSEHDSSYSMVEISAHLEEADCSVRRLIRNYILLHLGNWAVSPEVLFPVLAAFLNKMLLKPGIFDHQNLFSLKLCMFNATSGFLHMSETAAPGLIQGVFSAE